MMNCIDNETTLWKLWDYLILCDDPYFYIFIILSLFKLKEDIFIETIKKCISQQLETNEMKQTIIIEEITKIMNETITSEQMDILLSISSYLRGHTPLTFFRYITSAITYSLNFQKTYSKTLKNSMIV